MEGAGSLAERYAVWGVVCGLVALTLSALLSSIPNDGGLSVTVTALAVGHVLLTPVAIYFDTARMASVTDWRPNRTVWTLLTLVPVVQTVVAVAYLLTRTWVRCSDTIERRALGGFTLAFTVPLGCLSLAGVLFIVLSAGADAGSGTGASSGPFVSVLITLAFLGIGTHLVGIPVSMYADTEYVRENYGWTLARDLWVGLSLIPLVGTVVALVYLRKRRRERVRSKADSSTRGQSQSASTAEPSANRGSDRLVTTLRLGIDVVVSFVVAYLSALLAVSVVFLVASLPLIVGVALPELHVVPEWSLTALVVGVGFAVTVLVWLGASGICAGSERRLGRRIDQSGS